MADSLTVLADAQRDMRFAYLRGAPGLLASACVWLAAGCLALYSAPKTAILAFLLGGVMIHPLAVLLARLLGRPGAHSRGNPLGMLALEGTFLLLLCLPVAYAVSLFRPEWFFPAMLLVIGGRYFTFSTLYGLRLYWACGAVLALAGFVLASSGAPLAVGPFAGAAIEVAFAAAIFAGARHE